MLSLCIPFALYIYTHTYPGVEVERHWLSDSVLHPIAARSAWPEGTASSASGGPVGLTSQRRRPFIYVYDLPPTYNARWASLPPSLPVSSNLPAIQPACHFVVSSASLPTEVSRVYQLIFNGPSRLTSSSSPLLQDAPIQGGQGAVCLEALWGPQWVLPWDLDLWDRATDARDDGTERAQV